MIELAFYNFFSVSSVLRLVGQFLFLSYLGKTRLLHIINVSKYLFVLQVKDGVSVADELVVEGNNDLKQCLLQKNSTKKELQRAQCKIETGMKRRQELEEEKQVLEKRLKELE